MKKSMMWMSVLVTGLTLTAAGAYACDKHASAAAAAEPTSAVVKVSDSGSCAAKASMASAGCGMKSSMAGLMKSAPGTKMSYAKVDGGIALVITAASKEYVPVVQQAIATRLDDMKVITAHSATKVSSGSSCCATKASAMKVSDGATCATKASTSTASVTKVSDGASCGTKTTAMTASASTESCPEWMKVLCGANCTVENTPTGVKVVWTTAEKNMVQQVQAAGEQLHADLAL